MIRRRYMPSNLSKYRVLFSKFFQHADECTCPDRVNKIFTRADTRCQELFCIQKPMATAYYSLVISEKQAYS